MPAGTSRTEPAARVALATAQGAWEHDEDAPALVAALAMADVAATPAVWSDTSVDWAAFDLVVVRSTWDYTAHRAQFIEWAEKVQSLTRLQNHPDVLRWNTDKSYLGELRAAGLAVVATTYLRAGSDTEQDPFVTLGPVTNVVVKPTVSAGSKDTARYSLDQRAAASDHVRRLLDDGRDVMVQPYLDSVDTAGETGMVFLGGEFSHAFRKGPLLLDGPAAVDGLFAVEQIDPRVATPAELDLADRTLTEVSRLTGIDDLLYARVDVLADPDGEPLILEVELTEPSWFLEQSDGAPSRAAAAILRAATG